MSLYKAELTYLESKGYQAIDTGILGKSGLEVEFKFNITYAGQTQEFFGSRLDAQNAFELGLYVPSAGNVLWHRYKGEYFEGQTATINTDYTIKAHFYAGEQWVELNGDRSITASVADSLDTTKTLYLFNVNGSPSFYSRIKMYYCKIWDNGTLVRDFIPVLDNNNKPAMFDKITSQLFYNIESGDDFSYEEPVPVVTNKGNKKLLRKKLALMLATLKKKRPYYCEVEYLESTGTQWIDTGLRLTQNNAIEVCYKINSISSFSGILGARTSASSNNISVNANTGGSGSPFISVDFNNSNFENYRARYDTTTSDKILAYLDKHIRKISIDNSVVASNDTECADAIETQSNCLLFRAAGINGYCDLNMYYCKIWDNDTLVRDFIPVLDWGMTPCMYDKVSGQLFYNKGTGDFSYGREIHEVEYLESTGTPYIDTGIQPTDEYGYRIKNTYTRGGGEQCAIGGMDSGNRFVGVYTSGSANQLSGAWGSFVSFFPTYPWDTGDILDVEVNYKNSRKMIVNGTELKDISDIHISGTIRNTLYLFARNYGDNITKMRGKIYGVEITNGQDVVADFIPAVDENGVGFMFDRVSHTIFDNAGTSVFSYPPVELEYLESTGTQYINTGIIGTNENTGIDISWAFSNNNANMCIFSSRSAQTSNTFTLFWLKTVSNRMRFDGRGQAYFTDSVNASVSDDIFNFNYKSKTGAVTTLTNKTTGQVQTTTVGKLETFSTNPLYLFCSRDTAYVYSWIKMYGCKIYDGDIVVCDFVPVFYNEQAGMWDKANNVFYPSAGTNPFVVGKVIEKEYE